jgi:hypothetical protein
MNKVIAGIAAAGVLAFGGTADIVPVTPAMIDTAALYDTPSGDIEVGYYMVDKKGTPRAHVAERITATSTLSEGFYPEAVGTLAHEIGTQWVFYDSSGKEIGRSTDTTIATKLITPREPLPTVNVSIASLVLP